MDNGIRRIFWCSFIATSLGSYFAEPVLAVDPNPLQNAYWRFEEGPNLTFVDSSVADPVLDSINENHLDAFSASSSPLYVDVVPPTPLKSGAANTLALDFVPNNDLFTLFTDGDQDKGEGKMINNGIIAAGEGFTLEAAFRPRTLDQFQAIVAKEGRPAEGDLGGAFEENLPTLALKIRGDTNVLQIEQWDGAQNLVQVSSTSALSTDQWYYAAVVNTGSELSLYLDSNDGSGYQLQGSTPVDGALFQGDNPESPDWSHSWTIGRGQFGGGPADFYDGVIDEVRLSNTALSPADFLFAQESELLVGDYNGDGKVGAEDYTVWQDTFGSTSDLRADGSGNGMVGPEDYAFWADNFGNMQMNGSALASSVVPEPATVLLMLLALGGLLVSRKRPSLSI